MKILLGVISFIILSGIIIGVVIYFVNAKNKSVIIEAHNRKESAAYDLNVENNIQDNHESPNSPEFNEIPKDNDGNHFNDLESHKHMSDKMTALNSPQKLS